MTRGDGERPYNTPKKKKRGGSIKNREEQSKKRGKTQCRLEDT